MSDTVPTGPARNGTGDADQLTDDPPTRWRYRGLVETAGFVVAAVLLAVVVKTFFVQSFWIPSESMVPGLQVKDRILVEKPSYWGDGTPRRGDVVVFKDPGHWLPPSENPRPSGVAKVLAKIGLYPTGGHLVKRVIGLPGDFIVCCNADGQLSVNGKAIDESDFINHGGPSGGCDGPMPKGTLHCHWSVGPVPPGELFVMGDNRNDSGDSSERLCPPDSSRCDPNAAYVPIEDVVGKVVALVWPPGRAAHIGTSSDFDAVPSP